MKSFEHDQLMYALGEAAGREDGLRAGRLAEIKNTEREKSVLIWRRAGLRN